jgi:hypothetical protein
VPRRHLADRLIDFVAERLIALEQGLRQLLERLPIGGDFVLEWLGMSNGWPKWTGRSIRR